MPFRNHLKKANYIYRHKGIGPLARFLVRRALIERVDRVVYEMYLDHEFDPVDWPDGYELQVFGPDNNSIPQGLLALLGGESSREYLDRLPEGDLMFAVKDIHNYLHYGFVFFRSPQVCIIGENCPVPLIGNCFTSPLARGRGLYRKALLEELACLKRGGHPRVVIETSTTNHASQRAIEAVGFRLVRTMEGYIFLRKIAAQWITLGAKRSFRVWIV